MSGSERVVFVEGNMGNPENNLLPYMDFSLNSTKEIWLRSMLSIQRLLNFVLNFQLPFPLQT